MKCVTTIEDVKSRNLEREATMFLLKHGFGTCGRPSGERGTSVFCTSTPMGGQPESSRRTIWRRKST